MQYRRLDDRTYRERLRIVIVDAEGLHARAQDVGDGRATIGYGYTFNRNDNVAIWRESGIQLTPQAWQQLSAIDRAPSDPVSIKTALALEFVRALDALESEELLRASLVEYERPANALAMPASDERIAMVSLAYNRGVGTLIQHPIMDAIREGDRAEAWFQMRYNCWGTADAHLEGGLRKRRFAEAHVFGLYDDVDAISLEEARNVYRMLELHRVEIDRVERAFGVPLDGGAARPNRIAQANRDFPQLVAAYGRVPSIADAIAPAKAVLLDTLRREHPDLAVDLSDARVEASNIHLDPGRATRDPASVAVLHDGTGRVAGLRRHELQNAPSAAVAEVWAATLDATVVVGRIEQSRVDLLIGEAGNDTLRGGLGADILLGGAGDDRYEVDAGDIVKDSDGRGTLVWAGRVLDGGVLDPVTGQFRSADGTYTYVLEATRLVITNTAGESVRVEGFHAGNLGIRLDTTDLRAHDAPMPPPMDPRNPAHRDHALFQQAERAVARIDADLVRDRDASSERMIAAGVLLARANGLERIDHLLLSRQTASVAAGHNVFVVCGPLDDPASLRAHMPTATALGTPSQQSYAQIEALRPDRSQDVDLHLQRQDIEARAVHRMQGA